MGKWDETRMLAKIAQMYYIDDLTQSQISERLGIYRTTISRLLKKAREEGIVSISIKCDDNECFVMEKQIENIFKLKEVIIIPSRNASTEQMSKKMMGNAGAEYLKRIAKDGDVIGFAWGTTMAALANELNNCNRITANIIPLVGGSGNVAGEYHVNTIVSKVSAAFGAKGHFLYAPAITAEKETKKAIMADNNLKPILELWDKVDIAVVGIGAPIKSSNLVWTGYFGNDDIELLKKANAIGEICSRFYDINGNIIKSDLDDRIISIELEKLKSAKYRIGIAESSEKVPSILGALKGGFINVFITTENTARLLLDLANKM
ncbi:sugar-binding transcriptional regulator [Thermoanaerobacterium thermosaccharolyticum]|uniref:sugar-binding transcriptional regulator n=1 Tax=Thermoanaerobacterium thermosaccharolyticum TaxID=1517 RepID=UPI0020A39889|nr:sugar-binding transcriptional regulator [Thermoanaerobacterium thermosaccharolyticum]MCP2238902.1 DNA-binding transcriptional regulator LsrR (DeoR family) [Thermoanaerobacterium thermosaccharolyticum]